MEYLQFSFYQSNYQPILTTDYDKGELNIEGYKMSPI